MCAAWIALEDISARAGRFFICPRSHRIRLSDHSLANNIAENHEAYIQSVVAEIKRQALGIRAPALRKGDVLVWNSLTIHGSLDSQDVECARSSITCHAIPRSKDFLQLQSRVLKLKVDDIAGTAIFRPKDLASAKNRAVLFVEFAFPVAVLLVEEARHRLGGPAQDGLASAGESLTGRRRGSCMAKDGPSSAQARCSACLPPRRPSPVRRRSPPAWKSRACAATSRPSCRPPPKSQTVAVLDPATDVEIDSTVEVVQRSSTSRCWGVIGNGAKLRSVIRDGTPVLRYSVVAADRQNGTQSRGLMVQSLDIVGSLKDGPGLMLHAPSAAGPIYRAVLRDNTTTQSGGLGGLHIKGAVFELLVAGHMSENNRQNGVAIEHEGGAIVSNCMIHGLNSSRNGKAGLLTRANSVDVVQGSFVNNGACGVDAPAGLRSAAFINGENTGQFVFRIGGFASLYNCEASTDGKTIQHDLETGQPVGRPTEALVHYSAYSQYANDLILGGACKTVGYNGGRGYLALIRQESGSSTVWLEPWMDRSLVRRASHASLPAIRQIAAT